MSAKDKNSRKVMYEKNRKNTKLITILMVLGVILLIALISIWLFGGANDESEEETAEQVESEANQEDETDLVVEESEVVENEEPDVEDADENEELEQTEVEASDDNVIRAYEGNWNPIGTEQEGSHTVNFNEGSQDRIEMRNAILLATGLQETDYREWWVAGGGEEKVIATVSDSGETEVYRVYLSWVDGQGWQPTKVEELKENDWKKYQ